MKRRGRPRVDERDRSETVTITLPQKQYDQLCLAAQRRAVSVPAVIRLALKKARIKN